MFMICSRLNYIKVAFTNWNISLLSWVAGVSSTGTFVAPPELPLEFSDHRIPPNWNCPNHTHIIYAKDQQITQSYTRQINYQITYTVFDSSIKPVFTIVEGSLPDGITLDSSTGIISGTGSAIFDGYVKIKLSAEGCQDTIIKIPIILHDKDPNILFEFPCTSLSDYYVCNPSLSKPFSLSQVSGSSKISFFSENDINYIQLENVTNRSLSYTIQSTNFKQNVPIKGNTPLSVSFKINIQSTMTTGNYNVIELYTGSGAGKNFRIGLQGTADGSYLYLDVYNGGDGGTGSVQTTDRILPYGEWVDVVVTYDPISKYITWYFNKEIKAQNILSTGSLDLDIDSISIGAYAKEYNWRNSQKCWLSDITIWTKVLTDDEIQSL